MSVLTCDRDLMDLKDNLFTSIVERYAIMKLIKIRLDILSDDDNKRYSRGELKFSITFDEIQNEVGRVVKLIMDEKDENVIRVNFTLYRQDRGRYYFETVRIPEWLAKFILEYKFSINCYSINRQTEMKYNFKYLMDPTKSLKYVRYHVVPRTIFYPGYLRECENICKFVRIERENPSEITSFTNKGVDII